MTPLIVAIATGALFFIVAAVVITRLSAGKSGHTQKALSQILSDNESTGFQEESIIRTDFSGSPVLRAVSGLPFGEAIGERILRAGMEKNAGAVLVALLVLVIGVPIAIKLAGGGLIVILLSIPLVVYAVWWWLGRRLKRRNAQFINDFPDVLDMIVRSVRSGFPLNAAINMVAENMEPPISTEFRQVADEVALGRPLDYALTRLAQRIDEADVHFFVVVLKVQQETGGNLAEVISNLSMVIRKRKQLRLKIRAMTSEGRATGWILGALPVAVFGMIKWTEPMFLDPLFNDPKGQIWFGIAIFLVILTQIIVRKMTDVEI